MTPPTGPREAARQLIEEASSRGAHDDCMDKLLFTLEESGYAILPKTEARDGLDVERLAAALLVQYGGREDFRREDAAAIAAAYGGQPRSDALRAALVLLERWMFEANVPVSKWSVWHDTNRFLAAHGAGEEKP